MVKESENQGGFLLIGKPAGPTSHDIINQLRKITGIRKIGHAGTLDPFASGLLLVAVGREFTRQIDRFVKMDKTYVADLKLGAVSDTYDRTGKIERPKAEGRRPKKAIETLLKGLVGAQKQIPPMYSAKKIKGKKLYQLARQGIEIERAPTEIEVYSIKLLAYAWPDLKTEIRCSSGTYIRALAHDIGRALGCGAYLEELKRTAIGAYRLADAVAADSLDQSNWAGFLFGPESRS